MYFWSWGFQGIIALLFVLLIWSIPPPALAALLPFYSKKEFLWKEKMYVFVQKNNLHWQIIVNGRIKR